jgi:hypothetical protein
MKFPLKMTYSEALRDHVVVDAEQNVICPSELAAMANASHAMAELLRAKIANCCRQDAGEQFCDAGFGCGLLLAVLHAGGHKSGYEDMPAAMRKALADKARWVESQDKETL